MYCALNKGLWPPVPTGEVSRTLCTKAAWKGHLEMLQWLCNHNVKWDFNTHLDAWEGGKLEVLKWAKEMDVM
jgi:hypothetical protein